MSALLDTVVGSPEPCLWDKVSVEKFASEVAEKLGYKSDKDIGSFVEKLGGRIEYTDWDIALQTGSITVFGPGKFSIFLSPFSGVRRDRFTIAHELGHYMLHSRAGSNPIAVKRAGSGRVEWEANWFAAGFLMPRNEFKEKMAEGYTDAELAEHFGVSQNAVEIRKQNL